MGNVVLLGEHLVERVHGNSASQGIGDEVLHLVDGFLQHVVALVDARLLRRVAQRVVNVVLRRNVQANGHVVLGLHVYGEAVFHRAQADRGRLAFKDGDFHMKARAYEAVEFAQPFDDHGMLLLDDEKAVFDKQHNHDEDDDEHDDVANDEGCHGDPFRQDVWLVGTSRFPRAVHLAPSHWTGMPIVYRHAWAKRAPFVSRNAPFRKFCRSPMLAGEISESFFLHYRRQPVKILTRVKRNRSGSSVGRAGD